jgi:ABC-type transport system involved in cytochrome c biogenesis ATPase subunit
LKLTDTVAMMTPVLSVDHLCFSYPERLLWRELSLTIGPGITLVRGGDGTGKTTLLRLLAGQLAAQSGKLAFGDIALGAQTKRYQQQVFWIEPATRAFDALTPLGYFEAQRQGSQTFAAVNAPLMSDLVDGFSLAEHLHKPLYMLSAGTRRKVWLSAAFAAGAPLTLIDEPFAALDLPAIDFLTDLLIDAADHPTRAFVVAHFEPLGDVPVAQVIDLGDQG